jgi:hypothetical protein
VERQVRNADGEGAAVERLAYDEEAEVRLSGEVDAELTALIAALA